MKVALNISYNGASYLGSQIQTETKNTIFGVITQVLEQLKIKSKVVASGRTDRKVHALGQVCHVDLPDFWNDLNKLKYVINKALPSDIYVKKITEVSKDFHARYSAKRRVYRYIIKKDNPNPFEADFVSFMDDINLEQIQKNISLFKGTHDFKYFMKVGSDVKSTTRIIYKAFAYKHKAYIIINFEANGFLRSQIRLMVASLVKLTYEQIKEKLECKQNHLVKLAPANGLYLSKIKY